MFALKLWADSETLTSDTRIVKSAKEDDVVLPQRYSRYSLFKKEDMRTKAREIEPVS
jgi:hypothetical protein